MDAHPLSGLGDAEALSHRQVSVLGMHGSAFVRDFLESRLSAMREAALLVESLASHAPADFPALHIAFQLLVVCLAPKADHLLRHLPPAVTGQLARGVDQLLLERRTLSCDAVIGTTLK